MNPRFDSELLSALLDGELSPGEASALRQQIAESETLSAELAALESVSEAVQGLPAIAAPTNLHASVMDALPGPATPVPTKSPSTGQRRLRGWTGVAGGLVAAAALCVVVVVSNNDAGAPKAARGPVLTSRSADRVSESAEVPSSGSVASMAAPEVGSGVAMPGRGNSPMRAVVEKGLIQEEAELVRVSFRPDKLRRELKSARLSTTESSDAPEGYRAFVVEGSRSQINKVLKEFQDLTEDRSIEIDRHSVPHSIVVEFSMEAQQKRLLALEERGEATMAKPEPSAKKSMAARARGGILGGSRAPLGKRSQTGANQEHKSPREKFAVPAPAKAKEQIVVDSSKPDAASKVLFFYRLPAEAAGTKPADPCHGV